ncbi:tRNA uridine(34) 5-carboxymethylaminomethyl modification radical SAM/GNAT enzyme Elp3 [Candidatus Micrarchaeota archaeon]|nr:tRNA uridine(34) 5-carboxymethylaminomethyl modification radical SAM/GNAT enzyme Elp3 [Candidatus Micrarchaeota archaeon]
MRARAISLIVHSILSGETDLDRIKRQACKRFRISSMIKNPEILARFPKSKLTLEIRSLLLKKPTKTLSGVTPIAVMIKPQGSCRHGCIYCPAAGLAAKSYTGFEPAALRARQYSFDPARQASERARQLEEGGHPADKCEVIVMGGTFLETHKAYRRSFIKGIYDGLNGKKARSLAEAMRLNERARTHRVVGLTIETRPDTCVPYIDEMLSYGATRVELGVQHADDRIYRLINRGHRVKDVVDATRELKDAGFKVLYHIMPGLPGSDKEKDISFVRKLFSNPDFRPDMLKIYPTLVIPGTGLEKMAKEGGYSPYSTEEAADVISEFYRHIPPYVRVMRIQRDIPAAKISGGVNKSNLRELVENGLREKRITPDEIRYREIGLQRNNNKNNKMNAFAAGSGALPDFGVVSDFGMRSLVYDASGGKDVFLSYENGENIIAGFIRLRFPSNRDDCALIRELHVYGQEVPLKENPGAGVQHRGLGSRLLAEAELIAVDMGKERILVISGVGVREYYRRHGYRRAGHYMGKRL